MSNTNETSTNDTNDIEITMTNPMTTSSPTSSINASRENTFSSENEKSLRIALQESSDLTLRVRPTADLYLKTVQVKGDQITKRATIDELFSNQGIQFGRSLSFRGKPSKKTTAENDKTSDKIDGSSDKPVKVKEATKFGMLEGVFARCLLNIWGVIMFLRMGWIVAHAGAWEATSIVVVAMTITTLTTLSLSAICTNGAIQAGGAYFLISRNLGPELGGAIGILFSLANATAVALHLIGFGETLFGLYNGSGDGIPYPPPPEYYGGVVCPCVVRSGVTLCPPKDYLKSLTPLNETMVTPKQIGFITWCGLWDERVIAIISIILLIGIAMVGLEYVVKFQLGLLFLLVFSLGSYFIGTFTHVPREQYAYTGYSDTSLAANVNPQYSGTESWVSLFSVFFPASTGIMAGANISGDLKDAQKAIPKGTLMAVAVSGVTYIMMIWTLAATCTRDGGRGGLYKDNLIMLPIALDWIDSAKVSILIVGGIVASSLSSALAALVGAPRVFQAVCEDPLFPPLKPFAHGVGANNEPIRAYCLTFIIAVGFMMLGDLNTIAPFITNFFMVSYALINWACFQADMSGSPGWRPTWKFYNPWCALVGMVLCIGSMFMISWYVALITLLVCLGLYKYVEGLKVDVDWGSVGHALTWSDAIRQVTRLGKSKQEHVKNYRLSPLVMAGCPGERMDLLFFFHQLRRGGGLMVAGNIVAGDVKNQDAFVGITPLVKAHIRNNWYSENKFEVVQEVTVAETLLEGIRSLLLTCGVGKLRPNLVALGFRERWVSMNMLQETKRYVQSIRDSIRLDFSVAILRNYVHKRFGKQELKVDGKAALLELAKNDGVTIDMITEQSFSGAVDENRKNQEALNTTLRGIVTERLIGPESRNGTIDIWWMDDSGGISLLLPHVLQRHVNWRKCDLRVIVPRDPSVESKEKQIQSVKDLLQRVRIAVKEIIVVNLKTAKIGAGSSMKSKCDAMYTRVCKMIEQDKKENPDITNDETKKSNNDGDTAAGAVKADQNIQKKLSQSALLGEAIANTSTDDTEIVVVSMPFPSTTINPFVYMGMLDLTSNPTQKPTLFIRGTQKRILSMDS